MDQYIVFIRHHRLLKLSELHRVFFTVLRQYHLIDFVEESEEALFHKVKLQNIPDIHLL